jgi:small subunit ribosomal protein S13
MAEEKMKEEKEGERAEQKQKARETSIIRIAGRDINGNFKIVHALMQIKGIGFNMAHAISLMCERQYNINPNLEIGSLDEAQLAKIENALNNPLKIGIPTYLSNRRKDLDSGSDMHLVGTDLTFRTRQDVESGIRMQTWVGSRHQYGQKVRGQRTRSTGRTGATIGVVKKSVQTTGTAAQQAGAQTAKQEAAKK